MEPSIKLQVPDCLRNVKYYRAALVVKQKSQEDKTLASCYRKSLELARKYSIKSIAFPAISTGAYGFPSKRASGIAVKEISRFLQENETPETVLLVCFNAQTFMDLKKP